MSALPDIKYVKPEDAVPFDSVEFQMAFAYAVEVGHAPATLLNKPSDVKFRLKDGTKTKQYTFADVPMNRLGFAMVQRFRNDQTKFFSFMWRWFAFMELNHSGALGDEFRKRAESEDDPDMIHPCVIELAGSFPLNSKGNFEHSAFLAELRQRLSEDGDSAA